MSRRLIDCFYPILLAISIAAMLPIPASAGVPILDRSMVPVTDFPTSGSLNRIGECCPVRWGAADSGAADLGASRCGYNVTSGSVTGGGFTGGTHDSVPSHRIASLSRRDFVPSQLTSNAEVSLAPTKADGGVSIPSAIMAVASVRVQQIVEPFAMVGPRLAPSRESLIDFLDWCNHITDSEAGSPALIPDVQSSVDQMVSIDRLLDSLATEEPVDADVNHVELRNYVERVDGTPVDKIAVDKIAVDKINEEPSISVAKIDPLVGGSAMIATLGSGPFAGDVGKNDGSAMGQLQIWSVFPTVTRPFCVRHSFDHLAIDRLGMVPVSSLRSFDDEVDHMATIGNVHWMLAEAQSSSYRAQMDAFIAAASSTVSLVRDIEHWAIRQDASAKELTLQKASSLLDLASVGSPDSDDALQSLGRNVAPWIFTGKQIASQAVVGVAKKMPSTAEPVAGQNAAAQLAAAAADSARQ